MIIEQDTQHLRELSHACKASPFAQSAMPAMDTSYLTTQVTTIIGQLHGLFDDIGVPNHDRESREAEVGAFLLCQHEFADAGVALCCLVRDLEQPASDSHCVSSTQKIVPFSSHVLTALCSEKTGLTEEAHRIIKSIRQMEASLEDDKVITSYRSEDEDIKVTVPLIRCLQSLKERHNTMAKLHRERFEQVKSKHLALVLRHSS